VGEKGLRKKQIARRRGKKKTSTPVPKNRPKRCAFCNGKEVKESNRGPYEVSGRGKGDWRGLVPWNRRGIKKIKPGTQRRGKKKRKSAVICDEEIRRGG